MDSQSQKAEAGSASRRRNRLDENFPSVGFVTFLLILTVGLLSMAGYKIFTLEHAKEHIEQERKALAKEREVQAALSAGLPELRQRHENLERRLKDLGEREQKLSGVLNNEEVRLNSLRKTSALEEEKLKELQLQNDAFKKEKDQIASGYSKELSSLNDKILAAKRELAPLKNSKESLQDRNAELRKSIQELEKREVQLKASCAGLEKQLDNQKEWLEKLKTDKTAFDEFSKSLAAFQTDLNRNLDGITSQLQSAAQKTDSANKDFEKNNSEMQASSNSLQKVLGNLESELQAWQKARKDSAESSASELSTLKKTSSSLASPAADLNSILKTLKSSTDGVEKLRTQMSQRLDRLNGLVEKASKNQDALKEVASLQAEVHEMRQTLDSLSSQISSGTSNKE